MNLILNQEIDFYESYFMGRIYREKVILNAKLSLYVMKPNTFFLTDLVFKAGIYPFRPTIIFQKLHINIKSKN